MLSPEQTTDVRFRKIKHNPKEETSEFVLETPARGGHDLHTIETSDAPHPDFVKAFQALAPAVIEIAELGGVAKPVDIEVRSVAIHYHKNESIGVVITALRELKNSAAPLLINTPHKIFRNAPDGTGDEQIFPKKYVEKIDDLSTEAVLFIRGKRQQGDLFAAEDGSANRAENGYQPESDDGSGFSRIPAGSAADDLVGAASSSVDAGLI